MAAATGHRNKTPSYEIYAPRTSSQRIRLNRIAELTAGLASSHQKTSASSKAVGGTKPKGGGGDAELSVLMRSMMVMNPEPCHPQNKSSAYDVHYGEDFSDDEEDNDLLGGGLTTAQSHPTHATKPRDMIRHSLHVSHQTSAVLQSCITSTTHLTDALDSALSLSADIGIRHAELLHHSGELSTSAERLQSEESMLSAHASEIGAPLQHYDAVDTLGIRVGVLFKTTSTGKSSVVVRGLARVKVDSEEYVRILDEVDDAVEFFVRGEGNVSAEGVEYAKRALALHEACIFLIKEAVVDRIQQATADVTAALNIPKQILPADKLEASLVYTRFHGISSRSRMLLSLLIERVDKSNQYRDLLLLCRNTFCSSRESLLRHTVRAHMDTLKMQHGLVGMTRLACVFLMRICVIEGALYLDFFGGRKLSDIENVNDDGDSNAPDSPKTDEENNNNGPLTKISKSGTKNDPSKQNTSALEDKAFLVMLDSLCSPLHRTVRRGVVLLNDLDTLCQIVSVLREERSTANASLDTRAVARTISGIIEDSQERLIFVSQFLLQKEAVRFRPTAEDLNYPEKLLLLKENSQGDLNTTNEQQQEDAVKAQLKVYESWFPPMRSVLRVLSKIFRVVEPRVFEDIAFQAVQACTNCLKDAAQHILENKGVIHSDLFLVKHLLILREQLSPFDIELRAVERQLDFSEAGKAVTKFLANRNRQIFSMTTENALVTLLREGVSVQESSVDSKRDLEDALRSACNDFIEHTSVRSAGLLLDLIAQCKSSASDSKNQSFMAAENVKNVLLKTKEEIKNEMEETRNQMGIYLESTATQGILLKPVVRKICRSLDECRRHIVDIRDGENGWDSSFRAEALKLSQDIELILKDDSGRKTVVRR
mmetsp:Transcript_38412/g.44755  ORF Transcript_38412/g.44755 Transcript_38412/m.44755 type:complete len:881 (-) Transcript_38412:130-2772(-)